MVHYLDPYKSRTYPIIAGDWSAESFLAEFDDGEITHIEEEKAVYFYLMLSKFTPEPKPKYKPEDFTWTPHACVIVLHYDEYYINTKESGEWKKKKEIPGVLETEVCKYLLSKPEFLNKPVAGTIDFSNSNMARNGVTTDKLEVKLEWLENILGLYQLDNHSNDFSLPKYATKKSSFTGSKTTSYKSFSKEDYHEKSQFLLSTLTQILPNKPVNAELTLDRAITALADLSGNNPAFYKATMDYLNLLMK